MSTDIGRPASGAVPSLDVARQALAEARRMRGEWIYSVSTGMLEIVDLLNFAATPEGRPLRRIRLVQALAAQPDWTMERAASTTKLTVELAGGRQLSRRPVTVAWVIDPRSARRRIESLACALTTARRPELVGFPFTSPIAP